MTDGILGFRDKESTEHKRHISLVHLEAPVALVSRSIIRSSLIGLTPLFTAGTRCNPNHGL
jgi:hypothetical protein